MKIFIQILLSFSTAFIFITGCQNTNNKPEPELLNIELLRGDVILCSGGSFGKVSFSLGCKYLIRDTFDLAVSLLHSFEYDEAEKAFAKVIDKDPECAMAYWGVAMCNFHALWRPPTVQNLTKGTQAINIARSIKSKSERESEYIEAIAAFYTDWEILDHETRIKKFEHAMEKIYKKYPDDKEAAIFYALALNSAAELSDKTYKNRRKAGLILEKLFPDQPNHPGIAHYIIHSYDYPELAEMALPAARLYASIAPASSHAQHMPSHIFTRLGLWKESIQCNLNATSSAQCYAEQVGMEGNWDEEIHGIDYLVYAYLQTGQISQAKKLLDYLRSIKEISPIGVKAAYPSAAIPARFYLETRQWKNAANIEMTFQDFPITKFPWSNGIIHFAKALGKVHIGDLSGAKIELKILTKCYDYLEQAKNEYMANQVLIMVKAAKAWINLFEDNHEQALILMKYSADLEMKTEKQSLTPGEVLPAQELLGDMLSELGKPKEALEAYMLNLKIRPNRFNSIYGAAVASKEIGDDDKAKMYIETLLKLNISDTIERTEINHALLIIEEMNI